MDWEAREISKRQRLDILDKEFHDACASKKGAPIRRGFRELPLILIPTIMVTVERRCRL